MIRRRCNTEIVDDIAAIVEQMHGGLAWYPHNPVEVVRVPLRPVPDGIPHREDSP
jgi:hypothetical protein